LLTFFTQFAHPQVDLFATQRVSRPQVRGDLFVMRRDGAGQTRLTVSPEQQGTDAAWSPDGSSIVLEVTRGKGRQLVRSNADGSGGTQLTNSDGSNSVPSWSPDGRTITFSSTRKGRGEIFVMNADGSAQTPLTTRAKGNDFSPAQSPDGKRIAFHSNRDG